MTAPPAKPLSVSQVTRQIKNLLEEELPDIWVQGEISNLRRPASGHVYFTLKDSQAQLATVMFRGAASKVKFDLADGLEVLVHGNISVYERAGQYQVIVHHLLPKGLGALQAAFEELKRKLQKKGLFDPDHKQPLPVLPQRIGLVTSVTGAAIRDFLNVIGRRFPNVHIVVYPVRVQGDGAAEEIAAAIDDFNTWHEAGTLILDVLVITRGGGSLEDLWAFNEEPVAHALYRSQIPTISAVGHEIDFTIADFVADFRAPTPSAAAEQVVKAKDQFVAQLREYRQRLSKDLRLRLAELRQRYAALASSYVFRQPVEIVRQYGQRVDDQSDRLDRSTRQRVTQANIRLQLARQKLQLLSPRTLVAQWRQQLTVQVERLASRARHQHRTASHRLDRARVKLDLLSPRATLERGYSITQAADGRVIKTVSAVKPGQSVRTSVADGEFESEVTG